MKLNEFKKSLSKTQEVIIIGPKKINIKKKQNVELPIIFIDGGTRHNKIFNSKWMFSIGDGDSSRQKMDMKLNTTKDISDFKAALLMLPKNIQNVTLHGLFPLLKDENGFDYVLANLGDIYQFSLDNEAFVKLNKNSYILPRGKHFIDINSEFSLFSLQKQKIKIIGNCQYQLKSKTEINVLSSLGLSNKGFGIVEFTTEKPIIIIERVN